MYVQYTYLGTVACYVLDRVAYAIAILYCNSDDTDLRTRVHVYSTRVRTRVLLEYRGTNGRRLVGCSVNIKQWRHVFQMDNCRAFDNIRNNLTKLKHNDIRFYNTGTWYPICYAILQ